MLDTSAAAAIRKRASDMAYPLHYIDDVAVWPVSRSLATLIDYWRGCWLLNESRTMNQAPPILR